MFGSHFSSHVLGKFCVGHNVRVIFGDSNYVGHTLKVNFLEYLVWVTLYYLFNILEVGTFWVGHTLPVNFLKNLVWVTFCQSFWNIWCGSRFESHIFGTFGVGSRFESHFSWIKLCGSHFASHI